MSSARITCRCRSCGRSIPYDREDAGRQIDCPSCGKSVFLPGEVLSVAPLERRRKANFGGLALEIGGILMLGFFPWGTIAGLILLIIGWKRSFVPVCGSCQKVVKSMQLSKCPHCKALFMAEN